MTIEKVLAAPRSAVAAHLQHGFFAAEGADLLGLLTETAVFLERPAAEEDPSFKQVIPYVVVSHGDRFLAYQRLKQQGEARLHNKFSLGFGGHINDTDHLGTQTNLIWAATVRELNEEVFVPSVSQLSVAGFINDDSNPVGQVHLGVAIVARTSTDKFVVNEPDRIEALWVGAAEIEALFPRLETWSQLLWRQYLQPRLTAVAVPPVTQPV